MPPREARNGTARDLAAKHLAVTGASVATGAARYLASRRDGSSPLAGSSFSGTGAHTRTVRITVRVRPGSAHPGVGGRHDGALVVRVRERAGQATAAALVAVAAAFGVHRHAVTLITGESSRTKVVDVAGADPAVLDRLLAL